MRGPQQTGLTCKDGQTPAAALLQVQYVVMVNCGGASDIVQLLGLQNESETRVIIADSHRWRRTRPV